MSAIPPTSPGEASRGLRVGARAPGLIVLLAGALYLGTLRYGFVWDDLFLIVLNQFVRRLTDLPAWLTLTADQATFGAFSGNLYRPGLLVSMAVDFALWGERAAGFHLTNLLLHGLMVWLVYRLVRAVTTREELAAVTALLFAVHPTHVEAVAWISGRTDLWVSVFMLAATWLYHTSLRSWGWRRAGWYAGAMGAMSAGLFFKEAAVLLPAVFLLLEGLGPRVNAAHAGPWRQALLRSLPFWAIAVGHLAFLSRPLQTYNPGLLSPELLLARLPGSLETLARYVGLMLFPVTMRPFYALPRPASFLAPWPLAGAALLLVLLALGIFWWRRFPAAAFGLGWFLITVAPYLDLFAFSPRTMGLADRYLYGPSVGALLVAALLLDRMGDHLASRSGLLRSHLLGASTAALVLIFAGLTAWYMPVWRDNVSLYSRMVRDFPQAPEPHLNLGTTYLDLGEVDRGIAELEAAVRLRPDWIRPQISLALATVGARSPAAGFRLFDRIAGAAAGEHEYYVMRGRAHLTVREPEAAAEILSAGLQRFPASLDLHLLLARAREAQGDAAGAVQAYRRVLAMDPRLASAHEGLGRALAREGNYAAAAQAFTQALELRPDRLSLLRLLALAREAEGQVEESLRLWREVASRTQDPGTLAEAQARIQRLAGASPSRPAVPPRTP
ncbi:MAG: tetratricopeptide repeat protein [candidate division NC10 bacterium]|nr:tetratricopeptide repeat protein [candidate division NC10 bacterium]